MLVTPAWENGGSTPAINLEIADNVASPIPLFVPGGTLPDTYNFPDLPRGQRGTAYISPHGILNGAPQYFDASDLAKLRRGEGHIYLWGVADYDDTFPFSRHHITRFCYDYYGVLGNPADFSAVGEQQLLYRLCKTHNCVDEQCDEEDRRLAPHRPHGTSSAP